MAKSIPPDRLSDYTSWPLEILVTALTLTPILALVYFYPTLPERIPVFLNFRGAVEVWAEKNLVAVFRVPAMAIDLQLICLLMKYGTVKSSAIPPNGDGAYLQYQRRGIVLTTRLGLSPWARCYQDGRRVG